MDPVIDTKDGVVRTYVDAVGAVAEHAFAEATEEVSTGVEDHDGVVFVSAEDIDLVSGINRYARRLL